MKEMTAVMLYLGIKSESHYTKESRRSCGKLSSQSQKLDLSRLLGLPVDDISEMRPLAGFRCSVFKPIEICGLACYH
jgi:hypothetical protein